MNILFVCTGNLCRSPTAELLFQKMLAEAGHSNVSIGSRGVAAPEGQPMPDGARQALEKAGCAAIAHRSKQVQADDVERADLIFVMEEAQLKRLQTLFPDCAAKAFLLKEYAESQGDSDIADPMGGSPEDYEESRIEIQHALVDLLIKLAKDPALSSTLNQKELP